MDTGHGGGGPSDGASTTPRGFRQRCPSLFKEGSSFETSFTYVVCLDGLFMVLDGRSARKLESYPGVHVRVMAGVFNYKRTSPRELLFSF